MLSWSINLFRIRGIQLALHFSFVLWLAYWAYDGYQDNGMAGMAWSVATLLAFFTCVVLHELGHSFVGMHFGLNVRRILLMPIGGMAQFDSIPRQPRQELLMTVAGPAVNFAIAALLWFPVSFPESWTPADTPASLADLGRFILAANIIMGIFNLAPIFPMDGGRILRALLAMRLPYLRATFWAAMIGKVLSATAIVFALYFGHYVLAALFVFILIAGDSEYRNVQRQEAVEEHWRNMAATMARLHEMSGTKEPPLL